MHLVDHARSYIEKNYDRPLADRFFRLMLAKILPFPARMRAVLPLARAVYPLVSVLKRLPKVGNRLATMVALVPERLPRSAERIEKPVKAQRRVAILQGCAQTVLRPSYNAAAKRLLARHEIEVVEIAGESCCGALVHHLGREHDALRFARNNVDAWIAEMDRGLEVILITASGCGTTIKDYGFMLRHDPEYAGKAARVSAIAKDITEFLASFGQLEFKTRSGIKVAYHSACSMQHGQQIRTEPKALLGEAGFDVWDIPEGHICCGSAGTYNLLQPEIAGKLRDRKLANIAKIKPQVIATGNVGCAVHLETGTDIPVVHTIELLDWATGGPSPPELEGIQPPRS
ncbi:glycolate oxidase iron-sulfur subunit [Methylobacterium gnaphalii]|uniref:Glycolate oxidase iron-sulfur subunit n=2 Tax=Methylobacterium gnaphalii TaxID=1010610 RepID=A0A512JQT9_9HYPH|nr:glycolate oxidase iron-sulfur subunit [Methylobacterium gnaphalii]GLS50892.1 glycolate oxidase iron-sulfur subunit [Methylobacterium gnaphalii]